MMHPPPQVLSAGSELDNGAIEEGTDQEREKMENNKY